MKNRGFTLAEVLVTLGIIGVVVAMTLPSIMGSYRKHVIENRLKKFYSISNQAIELSETQNGPKEHWSRCNKTTFTCDKWYEIYLQKYLNTVRVEHFSIAGGQNTAAWFEDGSVMIIKNGYDIYFYPFGKDFNKDKFLHTADDGTTSRPDSGRKFFAFSFRANHTTSQAEHYKGKGIEPYRALLCKVETNEYGEKKEVCNTISRQEYFDNPTYGCNESSPLKVYCTAIIQENGWKIPDDYPFKL